MKMKFSKTFNKITISRATQHFRGLQLQTIRIVNYYIIVTISRKILNIGSESPPVLSKPNWFSLFLFLWNVFDNNGKLIFWARLPILVFIRFLNTDWKMLPATKWCPGTNFLFLFAFVSLKAKREPVPQWANNYKQSNHVYTWMTCGCFEFCKLLL